MSLTYIQRERMRLPAISCCIALLWIVLETIDNIISVCGGVYSPTNSPDSFVQLLLDGSALTCFTNTPDNEQLHSVEFHSRRLCHALHCERYKLLALVPKRKRKKKH